MRYLLDTNVWIEALAGDPAATKSILLAAADEWCGYSAITRFEIFCFPNLSAADEQAFVKLLTEFSEVPVSGRVIDEAIHLRKATRIKMPDALIAATALTENAILVTRNVSDFQRIDGLRILDPISL